LATKNLALAISLFGYFLGNFEIGLQPILNLLRVCFKVVLTGAGPPLILTSKHSVGDPNTTESQILPQMPNFLAFSIQIIQ
jgi:hypothetical protein